MGVELWDGEEGQGSRWMRPGHLDGKLGLWVEEMVSSEMHAPRTSVGKDVVPGHTA